MKLLTLIIAIIIAVVIGLIGTAILIFSEASDPETAEEESLTRLERWLLRRRRRKIQREKNKVDKKVKKELDE